MQSCDSRLLVVHFFLWIMHTSTNASFVANGVESRYVRSCVLRGKLPTDRRVCGKSPLPHTSYQVQRERQFVPVTQDQIDILSTWYCEVHIQRAPSASVLYYWLYPTPIRALIDMYANAEFSHNPTTVTAVSTGRLLSTTRRRCRSEAPKLPPGEGPYAHGKNLPCYHGTALYIVVKEENTTQGWKKAGLFFCRAFRGKMRWNTTTIKIGIMMGSGMGQAEEYRSHHNKNHPITIITEIRTTHQFCQYHAVNFLPISPPGVASHHIRNPPRTFYRIIIHTTIILHV